jgi:uncharacterized protein (DUF2147 family)
MKKVFFATILILFAFTSFAQDITTGTWYNEEKTSKVQFYKDGDKISGKIVWLKDPLEGGKTKVDKNNPDEKLKAKPLMGLVFLKGFKKVADGEWENGTIYDPRNGKTYSSQMKQSGAKQLDVRGYVGVPMFGRTSKFTRAD